MKEEDIRPSAIFDSYLTLAEQDAQLYFSESSRTAIACPACGAKGKQAFVKAEFAYDECPACHSIYVSPRPEVDAFIKYYTESRSAEYWATDFYKKTEDARRQNLWVPKARETAKTIEKYCPQETMTVVDIGGGYGIFAQEMSKLTADKTIIIEPGPKLAEGCRRQGFTVIEKFLEDVVKDDLPNLPKAFVSFELFEHLHSPSHFLACLYQLMDDRDLFIFSTLSGTGLDIRVLWEKSKSVSPPHHLNFFNPSSITHLLSKNGFYALEVSTPGKLDIDILKNNADAIEDRFWRHVVKNGSSSQLAALQKLISENLLSSHMRVVCKRSSE